MYNVVMHTSVCVSHYTDITLCYCMCKYYMYQYQQSSGRNVKGSVDGETIPMRTLMLLCRYAHYIIHVHVYLFTCACTNM